MIWFNGKLVPVDEPLFGASDRGVLLGDGLFETVKVAKGRALFLTPHLCRMAVSGDELGIKIDRGLLREGVEAVLAASGPWPSGSLRITVTRGPGPRGLLPIDPGAQAPCHLVAFYPETPKSEPVGPILDRLIPSPILRPSSSVTARHKTLSYADNLAARALAAKEGAADAVFFNECGEAASTSMANLFIRVGDGFITPPISAGILPGIVRQALLEAARALSVRIKVTGVLAQELRDRPLYRTNSLIGVRPAWYDYGRGAEAPVGDDDDVLAQLYRHAEREEAR